MAIHCKVKLGDMDESDALTEGPAPRAPIFISYSRQDEATAAKLQALLTEEGHEVWWDALIQGGQRYAQIIEERLEAASAIIVLWSKHAIESEWVLDEAAKGRDRSVLLPVSIDGIEPPLGFRQRQVIDTSGSKYSRYDPAIERLLAGLETVLHGDTLPPMPAATSADISRRKVLLGGGAVAAVAATGSAVFFKDALFGGGTAERSIAILPFENLSGNAEQDYLASGLAEELRSLLSQHPDILVAAQTSSAQASGEEGDARTIARRLKVANVLEGSVRRAGEMVRVAVRLINGDDGFEQWSESFNRNFNDILALQRDVSGSVADMLAVELQADQGLAPTGGTASAAALDSFLKGADLYRQAIGEDSDRQALAHFDDALTIDPQYAAAHAARSRALTVIANNYSTGDELAGLYESALDAARTATDIAPNFATAQSALGFILLNGYLNIASATDAYQRSYETGFGDANILAGYANFGARVGLFDDARRAVKRAERLDPLNASILRIEGLIEMNAGDFAAARIPLRQAVVLNEDVRSVRSLLGTMAFSEGDLDAARTAFEEEPSGLSRRRGLAIVAQALGDQATADRYRQELVDEYGSNSLYQLAQIDANSATPEQALDNLEAALAAGDSGLVQMRYDLFLDPVRDHPRFKALEERLGFSP